jgi:hypothetical protein
MEFNRLLFIELLFGASIQPQNLVYEAFIEANNCFLTEKHLFC